MRLLAAALLLATVLPAGSAPAAASVGRTPVSFTHHYEGMCTDGADARA